MVAVPFAGDPSGARDPGRSIAHLVECETSPRRTWILVEPLRSTVGESTLTADGRALRDPGFEQIGDRAAPVATEGERHPRARAAPAPVPLPAAVGDAWQAFAAGPEAWHDD